MINFSEFFVSVDTESGTYNKANYSIYYRIISPEFESDIKADIILISGFCTNVTHYTEISYYFAKNGFRVILIDPPGFGLSSGLRAGLDNYDDKDNSNVFTQATIIIYYQIINSVLNDVYKNTNINKPKISLGDGFGGFLGTYHQNNLRSLFSYIEGDTTNKFIANITLEFESLSKFQNYDENI